MPGFTGCDPGWLLQLLGCGGRNAGEVHRVSGLGLDLARSLGAPAGHSPRMSRPCPLPLPPRSSVGSRQGKSEGPRGNAFPGINLLPRSPPEDQHSTNGWLKNFTNGLSVTVACLYGPLQPQTSMAEEEPVVCWQLVPCEVDPLQLGPVTEQDHLPLLLDRWEATGAGSLLLGDQVLHSLSQRATFYCT